MGNFNCFKGVTRHTTHFPVCCDCLLLIILMMMMICKVHVHIMNIRKIPNMNQILIEWYHRYIYLIHVYSLVLAISISISIIHSSPIISCVCVCVCVRVWLWPRLNWLWLTFNCILSLKSLLRPSFHSMPSVVLACLVLSPFVPVSCERRSYS